MAQRRRDIADEVAAGGVVTGSRKEMLKSRKQMKFIISFFDRVRRMKKYFHYGILFRKNVFICIKLEKLGVLYIFIHEFADKKLK